ncbi:MAG: hypothetical protein RBR15_17005 [Sphaerochaeta sp.]|nr:hypothetical protein [Sphaerochaeta sp.]
MKKHVFTAMGFTLVLITLLGCSMPHTGITIDMPDYTLHIDLQESTVVTNLASVSSDPPAGFSGLYVSRVLYETDRAVAKASFSKLSSKDVSRDLPTTLYDISENVQLWLMTTRRDGDEPIASENTRTIKKYTTNENGEFLIPGRDLPEYTFVIFVMNLPEEGNPEVIGFLALEAAEGDPIIEFPPASAISGTVKFGYVSLEDSSYYSKAQWDLSENQEAFTADIFEAMTQDVIIHNAALMALNVLANTQGGTRYTPSIGISYFYDDDTHPASSSDICWGNAEIRVYSHDTTSTVGLFRPDGVQVGKYVASYGSNSSAKWSFTLSLSDLKQFANPREIWLLRKEDGTIIAQFDLSIAILTDSLGNPIIPLIAPTTVISASDQESIETLEMNWYYFEPDGVTKHPLTNLSQINRFVDKNTFWFQGKSKADNNHFESYLFRKAGTGGFGGMQGDLMHITDISPLLTEDCFFVNMGYDFSLYTIEVWNKYQQ